jgi:multidrug efflux pump
MTKFFIDHPIAAWVVSIVITLLGAVAAMRLPIAQYPEITPPTVQVTASYPGASAQVVSDVVASPIEQQVNGVERMLYMSSQCTNDGNYTLNVTFEVGADLNMAQVLVQNRVALAMPQLPEEVQVLGVSTKKRSPSILLVINMISPDGSRDDLYLSNYATIQLRDELLRVKNVGDLQFLGQRDYAMRMWLDPDALATRNLTAVDVMNAVRNQNVQVAAGQIGQQPVPTGQQFQLPMTATGRLRTVEEFENIIVKVGQGEGDGTSSQVVRIKDVSRVELGAQSYDQICRLDGEPSVGLAIFQLPGSNALNVADDIKAKMRELRTRFPKGVDYKIVYDTTPFIEESVHEVFKTLRDAIILVAIVVLLFLQDWKAMILPMIDVPVSLIGTFAVMAMLGFSLNNLTLFGLVLAIGIVVDDAIVVLENIERLLATGMKPREATIQAMKEVTGPIIAITLVLCSVFLPSIFIPGITGQFYRQFAITISVSMIISAINAMTLTPSRAVTIFKSEDSAHGHEHQREALPWWFFALLGGWITYVFLKEPIAHMLGESLEHDYYMDPIPAWRGWMISLAAFLPGAIAGGVIGKIIIKPVNAFLSVIFKAFNRLFDSFTGGYSRFVSRSLRLSAIVGLVYAGLLCATYFGLTKSPTAFIPVQDQGYLLVNVQLPDSASVQRTAKVMEQVEKICHSIDGVAHTNGIAGQSFLTFSNGSNLGSMFVILDSFEERGTPETYDATIQQKIQAKCLAEVDEAIVQVFRSPPIQGLGSAGGLKLMNEQRGFVDLPALQSSTDELIAEINKRQDLVIGSMTLFRANTPQLFIDIDRIKCESLQVPVQDVFTTLQVYMGGLYVNNFNEFGRTWQVRMQADGPFRSDSASVGELRVRNRQGEMVPLGTLAQIRDVSGPVIVTRYNTYTAADVTIAPQASASSGTTMTTIAGIARGMGLDFEWTEIAFLQQQEGSGAIMVFGLATLLVFLVLAFKYESWNLPLAVILVVPMCILAAVTGMFIAQLPVDIFVQIGFLVLVALACKNAILIVEFAKQLQDEGQPLFEAAVNASRLRFRPIVMTSFAFILGVVPLMLGHGAGAEMRRSLGVAVFSGMLGVTFFGVILTPVFFYVVRRFTGGETVSPPEGTTSTFLADTSAEEPPH